MYDQVVSLLQDYPPGGGRLNSDFFEKSRQFKKNQAICSQKAKKIFVFDSWSAFFLNFLRILYVVLLMLSKLRSVFQYFLFLSEFNSCSTKIKEEEIERKHEQFLNNSSANIWCLSQKQKYQFSKNALRSICRTLLQKYFLQCNKFKPNFFVKFDLYLSVLNLQLQITELVTNFVTFIWRNSWQVVGSLYTIDKQYSFLNEF